MDTTTSTSRVAKLSLLLVTCLALAHAVSYLEPFEDSFISFRYATHWAAGHGFVWNPGERVEGFTSPTWVVLLGAVVRLGLPVEQVAPLLSIAAGVAALVLLARLAKRWTGSEWVGVAAVAFVGARASFAYWAASGMEQTLFVALLLGGIALGQREGGRAALGAGLVLGLATLTRPEGAGYSAAIVLVELSSAEGRRRAARLVLAWLAVVVPFLAWRHHYFGWFLPNTYYAKTGPLAERWWPGVVQLERYLTLHLGWLELPAAVLVWRRRRGERWVLTAAAVVAAAYANLVWVGGDTFAFDRFLLPASFAAGPLLAEAARQKLGQRWRVAALAATLFTAALFVAAFLPTHSLLDEPGPSERARVGGVERMNADYFVVGRFLREHYPPDTLVALNAAGIVPFESKLRALDMLGLNDAHIAHRHMPRWEGAIGHQKHDAAYVLDRAPDLILPGLPLLIRSAGRPTPAAVSAALARYTPFLPGDRELLQSARLWADYSLEAARVTDDGYLVMFVRRGKR